MAGYPDRVARRREAHSPRFKLSTGAGAALGRESGVLDAEFIVAIDVRDAPLAGAGPVGQDRGMPEGTIKIAARLEPEWLFTTHSGVRCWFDEAEGLVRASRVDCYDAVTLRETAIAPDEEAAATILAEAWEAARSWSAGHHVAQSIEVCRPRTGRGGARQPSSSWKARAR